MSSFFLIFVLISLKSPPVLYELDYQPSGSLQATEIKGKWKFSICFFFFYSISNNFLRFSIFSVYVK